MRAAIAALERAVLRGPRPRPGAPGCAGAGDLPRATATNLHPADPRAKLTDVGTRCRADARRALGAALAPLEGCASASDPFARSRASCAGAAGAVARRCRNERAFAGADGAALARAFEDIAEQPADLADAAAPTMPSCSRPPSPTAVPPRRDARRARAHPRSARSAPCSVDRVVLGGWSRAPGRRRRAATPGLAGRCGSSSASTCRSGASAFPRTTSRNCSGRREVDPDARRQARRRADGGVALPAAARGGRRREHGRPRSRAANNISPGARARPRRNDRRRSRGRAEAAARARGRRASASPRSRLAARSLHDLCQAHPAAAAARCGRHAARRARPRHRDPRRDRRLHKKYATALPRRSARRAARARRDSISRRWTTTRRRARSGGRASSASRAGSSPGSAARRAECDDAAAEFAARLTIAVRRANVPAAWRAPTASSGCRDGSYAIVDYKTGTAPTEKQVRTGLAPQLTLEAAILRHGGFRRHRRRRVGRRIALRATARRRAARQAVSDRIQGGHARRRGRPRARAAHGIVARFEDPTRPIARSSSDVEGPLRRLRPSRAREGMVAAGGEERRGTATA